MEDVTVSSPNLHRFVTTTGLLYSFEEEFLMLRQSRMVKKLMRAVGDNT
jgi:hypothetical protein